MILTIAVHESIIMSTHVSSSIVREDRTAIEENSASKSAPAIDRLHSACTLSDQDSTE